MPIGNLPKETAMTISPDPQLEAALTAAARDRGLTPEDLVLDALRQRFLPRPLPFEPQDEWERRLLAIGIDCGVSLPDSAFLGEELY
jgi:hypothetical protein